MTKKKLHRVFVALELETQMPVAALRKSAAWNGTNCVRCLQAYANRIGLSKGNPVFPRRRKKA